jgi:hypothetical protein
MRLSFASAALYLSADTHAGMRILADPLTGASDRRCSPRSRACSALWCTGAGWLQAEVNQTISSPIAGSGFSADGEIMVLSVINFRPIRVEAESCSISTSRIFA